MASSKRNIQSLSPFSLFRLFFLRPKFCAFFRKVKVLKLLSAEHLNFYGPTLQPPFGTNMMGCIKCTAFDSGPASLGKEFNFSKHLRGFMNHGPWLWNCDPGLVAQCGNACASGKQISPQGPICPVPHHYTYSSFLPTRWQLKRVATAPSEGSPTVNRWKGETKVAKLLLRCIWANWKR